MILNDILEAISKPEIPLQSLRGVELSLDMAGKLCFNIGGNAVVIKVLYKGKKCALRCYPLKRQHLKQIYGEQYFERELSINDGEKFIDVVLCDWVEGEVLTTVLGRALERKDRDLLHSLSTAFDTLAYKMLNRTDWAHGDLSDSNIVVGEGGKMQLIDNDANYVAALAGGKKAEFGTPAYQSPLKSSMPYDGDMDDVSIAIISASLSALSLDPTLKEHFPFEDGVLINGAMILNRRYPLLDRIKDLFAREGEFVAYRITSLLSRYETHYRTLLPLIEFSTRLHLRAERDTDEIELFESMGLWGYCNTSSGEVVIPPLYDEAFEFCSGEALVRVRKWWFGIDRRGSVVRRFGECCDGKAPISRER